MAVRHITGSRESGPYAWAIMVAIFMLLCCSCITSEKAELMTKSGSKTRLRVITFNVLNGFKNDDRRHEQAVVWITSQKPDVVALQELNRYTEEKLKNDARLWGHPYVQLCKVKSGYHLGLTSRKPIKNVHFITKEGLWHGIFHGQTHGIDFFVLHLAPNTEDIRLMETKIVLNEIQKIQPSNRPTILLGDFNSLSRLDNDFYQRELKHEPKYSVMDHYLNRGWVDLVHQHHGTTIEKQSSIPSLLIETKSGSWRIDYILASTQLAKKCIAAQVMKGPSTDYLSDHYPVMADFDWP